MPQHARGAFYFGAPGISDMLKCTKNHTRMADGILSKLKQTGGFSGETTCDGCGTRLLVYNKGLEWETYEIAPHPIRGEKGGEVS